MNQFFDALEARRLLSAAATSALAASAVAADPANSALRFDGVNDFVDMGNPADNHFDLGENATIELKVNFAALPTPGSKATFMTKGVDGSRWFFGYQREVIEGIDVSGIEFEIETGSGMGSTTGGWIPQLNHWYDIAFIKTGNTSVTYINGDAQGNAATNLNPPRTTAPLQVGGSQGHDVINGMIDDVHLWATARTTAQVTADLSKPLLGTESGLEADWDFNENLDSQVALDKTAHHSDGRLGTSTGVDASDPTRVIISGGGGGGGGGDSGSISGKLFNDPNKNGLFDAGDSALSARKIYLDKNNNGKFDTGDITATTDANGEYHFTALAAGTYHVGRADTPAGYSFSVPAGGFWSVTLVAGQAATGKNFGVFQGTGGGGGGGGGGNTASISGTLFNDANKNGKFDAGDAMLANRKIYIDENNNNRFDAGDIVATTGADGEYHFTGLAAGTYHVGRADTPAGYSFSTPVGGFWSVMLAAGQTVGDKNFGVFQGTGGGGGGGNTGSISGIVFSDANKNGLFDSDVDSRLANKKIYIDLNTDGKFDAGDLSALSNSNGEYTFTGLAAGSYRVGRADVPTGFRLSVPSGGFYLITLSSGQAIGGKNIGAVPG